MNIFLALLLLAVIIVPLWLLFGGEERRGTGAASQDLPRPNRRSADRKTDLEKEIEQEAASSPKRRKSDSDHGEFVKVGSDFELPNKSNEIIPEDSPFSVYSRALSNVESYIQRGDFENAANLYEGIKNRISDADIRDKIDQNIDYLNNYEQVASNREEEFQRKKKSEEEREVKLSLSGDALSDKIQISMAPAEIDIEKLADQVQSKITAGTISFPQSESPDLSALKSQISTLQNELASMNAEKETIKHAKENELSDRLDEIQQLRKTVERLATEKDNADEISRTLREFGQTLSKSKDSEIESLKRDIAEIKNSQINNTSQKYAEESVSIAGEISALQNEIEYLRNERSRANALEERLAEMMQEKNFPRENTPVEYAPKSFEPEEKRDAEKDELRSEIEKLKKDIEKINERPQVQASTQGEVSNQGEAPLRPEDFAPPKDKTDDFETLSDLIKGPKYDEPTEDEIMDQILKSAAKENKDKLSAESAAAEKKDEKEELEIRGPKGEESLDIDLDKFLFSQTEKKHDDEQFYSSFMDRNVHKRKELPILRVTYSFDKLPERNTLSREQNVLEYSFYKYKPLIEKANDFIKRRKVKDALNYFKVILDQDIPEEFKSMLRQNVEDLNEYLQKYMNS